MNLLFSFYEFNEFIKFNEFKCLNRTCVGTSGVLLEAVVILGWFSKVTHCGYGDRHWMILGCITKLSTFDLQLICLELLAR